MKTRLPLTALAASEDWYYARLLNKRQDMEVVLLNSPGATEVMAHLLEFDSTHGKFSHPITFDKDWMDVGTGQIKVSHERDPALRMPNWMLMWCWECSGHFNSREKSSAHLTAGAKKCWFQRLLLTLILLLFTGLTTNICAPNINHVERVLHHKLSGTDGEVMNDTFGLISGNMTTIHAYTGDQNILDNSHKDLRRARSGARSVVPTTTGAAKGGWAGTTRVRWQAGWLCGARANRKCIGSGFAFLRKACDRDSVNAALTAADGPMQGVMNVNTLPLVSVDLTMTAIPVLPI